MQTCSGALLATIRFGISQILVFATLAFTSLMAGCSRFDLLNATISTCGYDRTANLAYGPLPRQKLDVYVPRHSSSNASGLATSPTADSVVIFFYGGDWQTGSKGDYRFVGEAIASQGFIAVLPDYRLYPQVRFPAFVEDGAGAVRWVHDHISRFGGDPGHLYLMGHSAGAHIVALLTLDRHYLQNVGLDQNVIRASAPLSGPYDFVPSPADAPVFAMKPGEPVTDPRIEPITFARGDAPPMLLVHGLADKTVDAGNARRLAEKIGAMGGEVLYAPYWNRGHVDVVLSLAAPFRWLTPALRDAITFFQEH
jgi:acetyl esterase/lipase